MKPFFKALLVAAACAALFTLAPKAHGQVDPGYKSYGLYQNNLLVGEIYREAIDLSNYTEHWVLYPRYIYPSAQNNVVTMIRPGLYSYRDTADFLARVPFTAGSRYVKTDCADGTTIPGR